MGFRLEWRLFGRGSALLDSGEIDGAFPDRRSALEALTELLLTFPTWGRVEADDYWWARRSSDADLEVRFTVCEPWSPAEQNVPGSWMRGQARRGAAVGA